MPLEELNNLERAVMTAITRLSEISSEDSEALQAQLGRALVSKRENTGHGFFTYFVTTEKSKLIEERVISTVKLYANIHGFEQPLLFALFCKDGVIHFLDGSAIGDDTTNVDFSNVSFELG
jgi:hypothetical protein